MFSTLTFSQEFSVSGSIQEVSGEPISFSNVILLTETDSTIVSGTSTDDYGRFKLRSVNKGTYLLKVTFIGFEDHFSQINVASDVTLEPIILKESTESLDEISITYQRPTVKKEPNKIVFNIENTALSQGNMMQVLKSTPGIMVIGNSISVKNESPTIFINGRKVHLSSTELAQLLESSDANNVQSVEVVTNPSAKYDASSGAVINIMMSKNLVTGYRGNMFTNYTQGVFPRYNVGTGHFFKSNKINLYASYSYTQDKLNRDNEDRINYYNGNTINEVWESRLNRNTWSKTHNVSFNFDYQFNDKNTLSLASTMLWLPDFEYKLNNHTNIFDDSNNLQSYFKAFNVNDDEKYNLGFDLDYVHKFNDNGEKLSFSSHFTTYDYQRHQNVNSDYYTNSGVFLTATNYLTDNNQDTKIVTASLDYTLPVNDSFILETGIKTSSVLTNSDITQYNVVNDQPILDTNNTNAFEYDELVLAAYANISKDWEKWSIIAGLRAEQTDVEGISVSNNQKTTQDYLKWFPNISLSFNPNENLSLYTNYKKSINRPDYKDLNPFQFYLNDNTIVSGNPNLQPVIVDHTVIGASLSSAYFIEAYYKKMSHNIYEIPLQDNANTTVTWTPINFDETIEYGFDFLTNFYVNDRWFVYAVTSFYNIEDINTLQNQKVKQSQWSNYSVLQNYYTFLKDRSLTLNVTLYYGSKNLQGFRLVKDRLSSNVAISKSLWNNKAVISLMAEDLFNTQDYDYTTRFLNQNSRSKADFDNRYIKIGFRYKFGNTLLDTNKRSKNLKERERLNE
ncbi:outer membrane beta-barrel family protein [Mangrovimonas spongiae]|uniref:outer membrane beta-barrel family protein n=1 Tax=Mangrovimonas spongiae TaxID=2494697 RepID=UPI001F0C1159|nr:outer membrane beta-barrel family protein [Mangrovimonas spongiae]